MILDGMPSPMLLFYVAIELVAWGLFILSRERHQPQTAMSDAS
jgi:hypothetical protein